MTDLEERMLVDMELKNFSSHTINAYLWHFKTFRSLFDKSPEDLNEEHVRTYLHYLKTERNAGASYLNQGYCALRFLYVQTMQANWNFGALPRPKLEKKLPFVLSRSEVKKIIDGIDNIKHRLIIMTTYSAGLRASETAHLKLRDIDSARMQIHVEQGKGKKDRYSLLSEILLQQLRRYWKIYRPKFWLFPGQNPTQPITRHSILYIFLKAKKKRISSS